MFHCNTAHRALPKSHWGSLDENSNAAVAWSPLTAAAGIYSTASRNSSHSFGNYFNVGARSGNCHTATLCTLPSPLVRGLSPLALIFGHCGGCLGGDVMREKTRSLITNLLPLMSLSVPG